MDPRLPGILSKDARRFPNEQIGVVAACWVALIVSQYAKSKVDEDDDDGEACGGFVWWFFVLLAVPFFVYAVKIVSERLDKENEARIDAGFVFLQGDIKWSLSNSIRYSSICSLAGVAAGLLGIGGGMVKGPLLLEMGVDPQVSAATAATMILFTSSATMTQFLLFRVISTNAAIQFAFLGMVGALIGQKAIGAVLKKYKRVSVITFSLAVVIGASCLLMGLTGIIQVNKDLRAHENLGVSSVCDAGAIAAGGH